MKFLKKDVSEANAVGKILNMVALSHPEVGIKFIRDGRLDLNTPGDGKIQSAIYAVYGKNFVSSLIEISYTLNGVTVSGFINNPNSARPNRSMQHFFINGRYVKTRTAMAALEEAYKGSIMVQKFPSCVLYINVPFSAVDVNVHPSKVEVRFIDEKPIFDVIYHGVKSTLMKNEPQIVMNLNNNAMEINQKQKIPDDNVQIKIEVSPGEKNHNTTLIRSSTPVYYSNTEPEIFIPKSASNFKSAAGTVKFNKEEIVFNDLQKNLSIDSDNKEIKKEQFKFGEHNLAVEDNEQNKKTTRVENKVDISINDADNQTIIRNLRESEDNLTVIGEAFKTYIIVQKNDSELILVDKHALHERMIYEKLKAKKGEESAQILLDPVAISVSKDEYNTILLNSEVFRDAGFDIEDFGTSTVVVRSTPIYLERQEVEQAVIEMADHIMQNKKDLTSSHVEWLYQNIACRAAIKAGINAKMEEMEALIKSASNEKHCPHGRPVSITIKKKDIEKQFGRIQ